MGGIIETMKAEVFLITEQGSVIALPLPKQEQSKYYECNEYSSTIKFDNQIYYLNPIAESQYKDPLTNQPFKYKFDYVVDTVHIATLYVSFRE